MTTDKTALINMNKIQEHLKEMANNARDNGYPHEVEAVQSIQDNLLDFVEESRAALTQPKADVEGLKLELCEKVKDPKWWQDTSLQRMRIQDVRRGVAFAVEDLAAQGYIGVPEGYTLVPIEPTREMILSGSIYYQRHGALSPCIPADIYKAMLKAAPKKEG